jgi:two-component sensor histidine kinase
VSGDTAIPLMLFVNEAMTNAYRHMPPEPDVAGQISVSLQPAGDGRVTLVIADNGGSLDAQSQLDTGMSIRLMHALVQQISGEMTIGTKDGGGTVVELSFAVQPDRTGPTK